MALELQLPLGSLRPVRIRELKESALCLSYDKRGIHFLVDRFEGNVKAILLNGEHAFHSFEAESANNWKGLALTGFEIVVDLDSAMDTENEWPPLGAISLGSNGVELRVTTSNHYGITDDMDLKLGIE